MSRKDLQHITLNYAENQAIHINNEANFCAEPHTKISSDSESDFESGAGFAPFLRGVSSTMYIRAPWDIQQSARLNTITEYNAFYKRNFKAGQRHFSLDFNCNRNETLRVDTLDQFKSVFKDIPLNAITISLKNDANVLANLAFYFATVETQGLDLNNVKGTFEVDVLENLNLLNNTENSEHSISDILELTKTEAPHFNVICICNDSSKHLSLETELALMLISGNNILKKGIDSGLKIDHITPSLSFNFEIGLNHFNEISKLRAARLLWAKIVKSYHPKDEKSLALHIHCKTKTTDPKNLNSENAVTKATIGALASIFGGTQSLKTQSVISSTLESERLDKNIQLFLQKETQITKTVDPWAGSFYVEKQTQELAKKAWSIFEAYQNTNKIPEDIQSALLQFEAHDLEYANVIQTLNPLPMNRDDDTVADLLSKLTEASKNNDKNRLTLAIKAVKSNATFSEICKDIN
ncbi:methylmalonyl-CoA mutase family protein [Formosa undariae]|uniref:Methylmalonyl-CoA mutase family protein n=1 Tax=Formosa undariae TaxID=1325436 RepID=A0ABV5F014_9FLAO